MELVKSVTPVEVELKQDSEAATEQEGTSANTKSDCFTVGQTSVNDDCYVSPVDLGHLTDEQKSIAIQMLKEESESFAKDNDDLGYAEDLQLKLTLATQHLYRKHILGYRAPCTQRSKVILNIF